MSSINNDIKIGDLISNSLNVLGGIFEAITNVTTSVDSTTGKTLYAITTASETLSLFHHQFELSDAQLPVANGVSKWVVGQNK